MTQKSIKDNWISTISSVQANNDSMKAYYNKNSRLKRFHSQNGEENDSQCSSQKSKDFN